MRRVLRAYCAALCLTLAVIIPVTMTTPASAGATARTGVISGRLEWCIPAVATTTLTVPTTVPGTTGTTTSVPSILPYRVLLIPPPSYALLLQGGVVVEREWLEVYLVPDGPKATPSEDGKFLMIARFALRAMPGHYLAQALQVRRHIVIVAGRTTHLHVLVEGC